MDFLNLLGSALGANDSELQQPSQNQEAPMKREVVLRQVPFEPTYEADLSSTPRISPTLRLEHPKDCKAFLFERHFFLAIDHGIFIYDAQGRLTRKLQTPPIIGPLHAIDSDRLLMKAKNGTWVWTISENDWVNVPSELGEFRALGWVDQTLIGFTTEPVQNHHSENSGSEETVWTISEANWRPTRATDPTLGGRLQNEEIKYSSGGLTKSYRTSPSSRIKYRAQSPIPVEQISNPHEPSSELLVFREGVLLPVEYWMALPRQDESNPGSEVYVSGRDGLLFSVFSDALLFWSDERLKPVECLSCGQSIDICNIECPCGGQLPSSTTRSNYFSGQLIPHQEYTRRLKNLSKFNISVKNSKVTICDREGILLGCRFFRQFPPKKVLLSKKYKRLYMVCGGMFSQPDHIAEYCLESELVTQPPRLYQLKHCYEDENKEPFELDFEFENASFKGPHLVIQGQEDHLLRIEQKGLVYETNEENSIE